MSKTKEYRHEFLKDNPEPQVIPLIEAAMDYAINKTLEDVKLRAISKTRYTKFDGNATTISMIDLDEIIKQIKI